MKGFDAKVTIQKLNATQYVVKGHLTYENDEISVTVNDGFITDGASTPRFLWRVIGSPFTGLYTGAAVIHDSLYGSHLLSKKDTDNLFLEMMEVEGVSCWKRNAMYYAVKWFGASSWDKKKEVIKRNRKYVEVRYENSIN